MWCDGLRKAVRIHEFIGRNDIARLLEGGHVVVHETSALQACACCDRLHADHPHATRGVRMEQRTRNQGLPDAGVSAGDKKTVNREL